MGRAALRAKIGPDEAESAAHGGTTLKDNNEVWRDFRRNPEGRGQFSRLRCRSSLEDAQYSLATLLALLVLTGPSLPDRQSAFVCVGE